MAKIDQSLILPGQILARHGFTWMDNLAGQLVSPETKYIHFSIFAFQDSDADWFTVESQTHTVLAPIKPYEGQEVRIYSVRYATPEDIDKALDIALDLAEDRVPYEKLGGWAYFLRLLPGGWKYWKEFGFKPVPYYKLPNIDRQDRINCLILLRRCYCFPDLIVADEYAMTPGAIEASYTHGLLKLEQEGVL